MTNNIKIITIIGARPQFIKAGSVSREISKYKNINEVLVHTGQHYDSNMSEIFFQDMQIPKPDYLLGIGGKSHGSMTGVMIEKIEEIVIKEDPDFVMVYGDTNSTLAGAIAASKLNVKIVHIEAGLRSFNMQMPEEVNRIITDRISTLLFCPTQLSLDNLKKEGIKLWKTGAKAFLVGDVMKDGVDFYKKFSQKPSGIDVSTKFVLCTIHRAENTDNFDRLTGILSALSVISKKTQIIMPLHPRTRRALLNVDHDLSNIVFIDPVGYLQMVWLIDNCSIVLTDSGGLQKEAYFFKKPCITLRDETEWVELVENKFNILSGSKEIDILHAFYNGQFSNDYDESMYGDGNACKYIVSEILNNCNS
jgi:UDP-GlcNAc3NAcA epimerase